MAALILALGVLAALAAAVTGLIAACPPVRRLRRSDDPEVRGAITGLLSLFAAVLFIGLVGAALWAGSRMGG
jgi:hypothetical protein